MVERGKVRRGLNGLWRCRTASCRSTLSLLSSTIFEATRLPISTSINLLFCFARSMSPSESALEARVSTQAVSRFFKIFRHLIVKNNRNNHVFIGVPGMTVERDECHLHSRKVNVGRIVASELWWVVG